MLYALSIQSFVLIDRLDLEAADGFTALTGETGAGKSIILDALGLVMGSPADRKQVRAGAEQANISAEFLLPPDHPAWAVLERHDLTFDRNEMLILRRTVSQSGPSRAFVNAQSVAAVILAELAEVLVEIHGQHAASQLMQLRQTHALGILDDHQAGVRDIDSDLDYRGRDQQLDHAIFEGLHATLFLDGPHAAVYEPDSSSTSLPLPSRQRVEQRLHRGPAVLGISLQPPDQDPAQPARDSRGRGRLQLALSDPADDLGRRLAVGWCSIRGLASRGGRRLSIGPPRASVVLP